MCSFPEWLIQSSVMSVRSIDSVAVCILFLRTYRYFLLPLTGNTAKHSEKKIVIQIKRNEGTRESKTFTRRRLQAEHQTGITRPKQNFAALADKSKNEREEAVRLFWTFQARVGGRRCRSCTRSQARIAKKRGKRRRPKSDFIVHHYTNCDRPLLRSGNDYDSAREKIWQASYDMRKLQDCKPKTNSLLFTIRMCSSNF